MQFYKEYINNDIIKENNNIIIGKLLCIDHKYYLENNELKNEIINNRGINGDDVYIENNIVIGIKNRNINDIIGILYLDSKVKYGLINGKVLYLFKPTNKKYPDFYVAYNNKNKNNKIYVIIKFKEWNTNNKLPIGILLETLGNIGNKEVEYEHLRYYYEIKNNIWKVSNDKKNNDIKLLNEINEKEDYEVFSIDPLGSKDIDDAFHFKELYSETHVKENTYEIGIHIASPFIFFSDYMDTILDRVSTVYLPDKKYNMLPNIYADDLLSLLENKKRYAISLILHIDNNNIIKNSFVKKTIVKNIKNYDYDTFDKIYNKNNNLKNFMIFSNKFFNKNNNIFNSHKLVEYWMIYANKFIAQYLINKNITNLIIRKYENSSLLNNKNEQNINEISNDLFNYLKIKSEHSATYEIYDINKNQKHEKLENDYYTHFTSPIRRAVDLFIHGLIINNNNLMTNDILELSINKINKFTKNNRKFDRNIRRFEFIYQTKKNTENIIIYCYITEIKQYSLKVYIPEYNLEEKIIIIPYKFKDIVNINLLKNDNDIIFEINYYYLNDDEKTEIRYNLYQKLDIKLWIFTSFDNIFDKLKIEIIKN